MTEAGEGRCYQHNQPRRLASEPIFGQNKFGGKSFDETRCGGGFLSIPPSPPLPIPRVSPPLKKRNANVCLLLLYSIRRTASPVTH